MVGDDNNGSSPSWTSLCSSDLGFKLQYGNIITAHSAVLIIATQILHAGVAIVVGSTLVGVFSAILGVALFKYLVNKELIKPKYVLVINASILLLVMVYVLYIKRSIDLLVMAAIAGAQVGPIEAISRSLVSSLIPKRHQSRLFSLYQFIQDSTSWIGSVIIAGVAGSYGGSDYVYVRTVALIVMVEIALGIPVLMMDYERGVALRQEIDNEELPDGSVFTSNVNSPQEKDSP